MLKTSRRSFFGFLAGAAAMATGVRARAASLLNQPASIMPGRVVYAWGEVEAIRDRNALLLFRHDYAGEPVAMFRNIPISVDG